MYDDIHVHVCNTCLRSYAVIFEQLRTLELHRSQWCLLFFMQFDTKLIINENDINNAKVISSEGCSESYVVSSSLSVEYWPGKVQALFKNIFVPSGRESEIFMQSRCIFYGCVMTFIDVQVTIKCKLFLFSKLDLIYISCNIAIWLYGLWFSYTSKKKTVFSLASTDAYNKLVAAGSGITLFSQALKYLGS